MSCTRSRRLACANRIGDFPRPGQPTGNGSAPF